MALTLTEQEEAILERARRGDWDAFTEHFLRLPLSGTWYTPEDRPERYGVLHSAWKAKGRPDGRFQLDLDDKPSEIVVSWIPGVYSGNPIFLIPHGFRTLPWLRRFLNPAVPLGIAIAGAGSGKSSGTAIFALMYCALFPGFRFLNVAPTATQAKLMLAEVEKWCLQTDFRRFVVESRGVNTLWVERPHPTLQVEVYPGFRSEFVCQTVGRDATGVLGGERDFISCDEAQLLENIDQAVPILATRLRGTRSTGALRLGMLRWIGNPGDNSELSFLMGRYKEIQKDSGEAMVLEGIDSKANIYLTARQLRQQELSFRSEREKARWHGGSMNAAGSESEISEELLKGCLGHVLETKVQEVGMYNDALGLYEYTLPWEEGHTYIVVGDVGKSSLATPASRNVPCVMVFDMTNFPESPTKLVAFHWMDGKGDYSVFVTRMQRMITHYHSQGFYDAQGTQTMLEDLGGSSTFANYPTTPIFMSGTSEPKNWAFSVLIQLMSDGCFEWPYLKGLWYQARKYNITSKKCPDDIIATLIVFCLALREDPELWERLVRRYSWATGDTVPDEPERDGWGQVYVDAPDRRARFL